MKNQNRKDDDGTLKVHESSKRKKKGSSGGGFESMGLSDAVFQGVKKIGFRIPTPVQRQALPVCLSGKDAVVMARTGSGKTAAFVLSILERLLAREQQQHGEGTNGSSVRALILSPTRELALQTLRVTQILASFTSFISVGIVGGDSIESQFSALSKRPHLIVATPGRLSHLLREIPDFTLENCHTLVLDEGDRLMEMGFLSQVREICAKMPSSESRQTMLFSATMPKSLVEFTRSGLVLGDDPAIVRLEKDVNVSEELRLGFITCRSDEKDAALLHLVRDICSTLPKLQQKGGSGTFDEDNVCEKHAKGKPMGLILIFAATRHHVEYLTTLLRLHNLHTTQIYGAMDHEARQAALSSFRRGVTPILVVTDVAARGIDVPLIDVVIHHSFPPSAKLFVHRSGRAARAGRLGWALALVDPEEMPYMADLHVFLGRKLTSAVNVPPYGLTGMSTDMVHYGSVPEAILMEEMESLQRILSRQISGGHASDVETVQSLHKVCANAMKQFRKSRPDASREGVRRAKELSNNNGGFGNFPPHPLLAHWERQQHVMMQKKGAETTGISSEASTADVETLWAVRKKRDEFLLAIANFRPKETIFESQASTLRSSTSVKSSQVDKNKSDALSSKARYESGLLAMKDMRRQMRLIKSKCVVAGSATALAQNSDPDAVNSSIPLLPEGTDPPTESSCLITESDLEIGESRPSVAVESISNSHSTVGYEKKRMSKAERKCLKVGKMNATIDSNYKRGIVKKGRDFRDNDNYIDVESAYDERSRKIDASLQPSAGEGNSVRSNALRLEESMLNILGDESADLVKQHRIMRWDKSKRKYVQTTLGAESSGESKSKRLKVESGQLVKHDKAKLGQLYEKWQKKTHKSIGRISVFDDVVDNEDLQAARDVNIRVHRSGPTGFGTKDQPKRKSAAQIRKEREDRSNLKRKNMKKSDRKRFESRNKAKSSDTTANIKKKQNLRGKK